MEYSYKDMVQEFKISMDSGDKWGSAIQTLFAVASELHHRAGYLVPSRWEYSPGASSDPRDSEDYFYAICMDSDSYDLIRFGNLLERYTRNLDRNGHSY